MQWSSNTLLLFPLWLYGWQKRPGQVCFLFLVVIVFVILTIDIVFCYSAIDDPFLENPKTLRRPLGANATFECRVRGVQLDSVHWCINGNASCNVVNDFENTSFGFNVTTSNAFLHVPATIVYNGSRFRCCFTDRHRRRLCSRPAKLFVFGKLEACRQLISYNKYRHSA